MANAKVNVNEIVKEQAQANVSRRAAMLAGLSKQMEAVNVLTDKARAKREEELKNNTVIMSVVASRGYVGFVAGDIAEEIVEPANVGKTVNKETGEQVSAPVATLVGACKAIAKAESYGKEHLVLYVNDFEARRISGMLSRINKGENIVLTPAEAEHINDPRNSAKYGAKYMSVAKKLFGLLLQAKDKFKSVRVMGHNSIFGWETKYNLPLDMENMELNFTKGMASTVFKGHNYRITLASGFKLNGKHKLVKANGNLVVEREIKKGSEQETARDLLSIVNQTIIIEDAKNRAEGYVDDGFEESVVEEPVQETTDELEFAA